MAKTALSILVTFFYTAAATLLTAVFWLASNPHTYRAELYAIGFLVLLLAGFYWWVSRHRRPAIPTLVVEIATVALIMLLVLLRQARDNCTP